MYRHVLADVCGPRSTSVSLCIRPVVHEIPVHHIPGQSRTLVIESNNSTTIDERLMNTVGTDGAPGPEARLAEKLRF
jgi:hypothetical protein